ncbi:MAG TPA: hypothetical protein VFA95_14005 [Gammaproteobacteria bacterium]|nr:hypothetical protein [Gammaproteobacteria bacterium]
MPDRKGNNGDDLVIGLDAVIAAVTDEVPRVLTVTGARHELASSAGRSPLDALPFGPLDPRRDVTLERALRGWVAEQTGLDLGYVEQLYTFGDRYRDPAERAGGPRVISVAYLALVAERSPTGPGEPGWRSIYDYLPWEDWREGRPALIDETIAPALGRWSEGAPPRPGFPDPRQRVDITFGLEGAPWDPERVLERYELLFEAGLVEEAGRHPRTPRTHRGPRTGRPMAQDHRRILATALGRLRGKIRYRPVVFEMLPPTFTLLQLQRLVEALSGVRLHKQNFRRLVEQAGLVEGTGRYELATGGRPAELFRFRREVLRERPAPGVGLPGVLR